MVETIQTIIRHKLFNNFIFAIILLSAIVIGLETYPEQMKHYKVILTLADKIIIAIFTIEILLKIIANGNKPWIYFADPWNVFDFLIVAFSIFMVVKAANQLQKPKPAAPAAPTTKDCPYCFTAIPIKATRCPHCTSEVKA